MKREKLIPLNIQLFAEGDGDGGSETSKTYSQEEMDKIIADLEKIKKANDNLSKENADYKRKTKEKMSEEEKKAKEQEEKDKLLADAQKELLSIKISKEFMIAGFDEKSTAEIVETFSTGDSIAFAKALSTHIQKLVENVSDLEEAIADYNKLIEDDEDVKAIDTLQHKTMFTDVMEENKGLRTVMIVLGTVTGLGLIYLAYLGIKKLKKFFR